MDLPAERPSTGSQTQKNRGGRPPGSRNRVSRRLQTILDKLEGDGSIKPYMWVKRLEEIGMSDDPDRVSALKMLLAYRFGGPPQRLEIENTLSESAESLLRRIAQSEEHRLRLEELERRRLKTAVITVDIEDAADAENEANTA